MRLILNEPTVDCTAIIVTNDSNITYHLLPL